MSFLFYASASLNAVFDIPIHSRVVPLIFFSKRKKEKTFYLIYYPFHYSSLPRTAGVHIFHHHLQGNNKKKSKMWLNARRREKNVRVVFISARIFTLHRSGKTKRIKKCHLFFFYLSSKDSFLIKQISYLIKIMIQKENRVRWRREDLKKNSISVPFIEKLSRWKRNPGWLIIRAFSFLPLNAIWSWRKLLL